MKKSQHLQKQRAPARPPKDNRKKTHNLGRRPAAVYLPNFKGMRWEFDPDTLKPRLVQRSNGQTVVQLKDGAYDLSTGVNHD